MVADMVVTEMDRMDQLWYKAMMKDLQVVVQNGVARAGRRRR